MVNPWDDVFREQGAFFVEPHEDMPAIVELLKSRNARTVLDLGSGSGRHTAYLAANGFAVYAFDESPEGIEITRRLLSEENLSADLRVHGMTERLPYDDSFFDAIVSTQVIHHARVAEIKGIVGEIGRVLKRGGFIFITVPKEKNQGENFREIEPGTFIPLDGHEKGMPHHYFTPDELRDLFSDFDVTDIHVDTVAHYCLSAYKI
jgi:SAM-dependent methyltransferase